MRRPLRYALGALLGGVLAVGAVPSAGSAGEQTTDPRGSAVSKAAATSAAAQAKVQAYWTPARMRAAKPADAGPAAASEAAPARGAATKLAASAAKKPAPQQMATTASVTSTTGKVFFSMGGGNYVCSGAATTSGNRSVVTTAGHCVKDGRGVWATNWAFVPAYHNGSRPYGTWTARNLVTTSRWASRGDISYDGGFAVMNALNGRYLTDVVGGQGIAFNQPRGLYYNAYGYPAEAPFTGQTLQSCAGYAQDDIYGGTQSQRIPCNMTGGSSGGPWLTGSYINSVNSFGYNGVPNQMFGPYFGSAIQSAYSTASTS